MSYEELLRSGRIRREDVSWGEVRAAMALAERDLRVARGMARQEMDWTFAIRAIYLTPRPPRGCSLVRSWKGAGGT